MWLIEQMFSEPYGFFHKFVSGVLLEPAQFLSPEVWIMGHYCVWVCISVLCRKTLVTTYSTRTRLVQIYLEILRCCSLSRDPFSFKYFMKAAVTTPLIKTNV